MKKISELIAALEALKAELGDLEVGIFNPEGLCGDATAEIGDVGIVQIVGDDEETVQIVVADEETCRVFSEDCCSDCDA